MLGLFTRRLLAPLLLAATCLFGTGAGATTLLSPLSTINGASMPDLVRAYMTWGANNPGFTVPQLPLIHAAPGGDVAFAPVTSIAGDHVLNFSIAPGTPLLVSSQFWTGFFDNDQSTDGPPCDTAADRFACHQEGFREFISSFGPPNLTLRVDGVDYSIGDERRFDSAGQPLILDFPQDTAFGLPAGQWNVLYDGWFAAFSDLSIGTHTVEYGFSDPDFGILHRATVNVVPIAPSSWLLGLGLVGLWLAAGLGVVQKSKWPLQFRAQRTPSLCRS